MTAALCLAITMWLIVPPGGGTGGLARLAPSPQRRRSRGAWIGIALIGGLGAVGVAAGAVPVLLLISVAGPVLTALWVVRRRIAERHVHRERAAVARACGVIASQLQIGRMPTAALATASEECPVLAEAAGICAIGGDVVAVWHEQAERPGRAGLRALARAWDLSRTTGAPMASALTTVAESLREDAEVRRTVAAELAAPLMTSRLLAVLPLAGVGLGYLIGGDPVGFLTGSAIGAACLVTGSALASAGVVWTERITARAAT